MLKSSTSTNLTIFILFFGISLLDAVSSHNWWRAAFWLVIGIVFAGAGWFSARRSAGVPPSLIR